MCFVVLLLLYQLPDDSSDDSKAQLWEDANGRRPEKPPVSSESEPMEEDVPETPAPAPVSAPTVSVRSVRSVRSRRSPVVVTSRTVVREQQTVPYDAYVGLSRECDFLRGQNYELRRLVDSLAVGPSRGVSAATQIPDFSARIRAIAHIAAQRLDAMVPDSDRRRAESSTGGAAEMASLTRWLVEEMRALGGPE